MSVYQVKLSPFIGVDETLISSAEEPHSHFSFVFPFSVLYPGIWAQIQMPQTSMDVIKGQMVVLRASYSTVPDQELSTNTILWNFVSNSTQLVRTQLVSHQV